MATQAPNSSETKLHDLPTELKTRIMDAMIEVHVQSTHNLARTRRVFRDIYHLRITARTPKEIKSLARSTFNPTLLPAMSLIPIDREFESQWKYSTTRLTLQERRAHLDICFARSCHLDRQQFSWSTFTEMQTIGNSVRELAHRYLDETLGKLFGGWLSRWPKSQTEIDRVQRSLLIFEHLMLTFMCVTGGDFNSIRVRDYSETEVHQIIKVFRWLAQKTDKVLKRHLTGYLGKKCCAGICQLAYMLASTRGLTRIADVLRADDQQAPSHHILSLLKIDPIFKNATIFQRDHYGLDDLQSLFNEVTPEHPTRKEAFQLHQKYWIHDRSFVFQWYIHPCCTQVSLVNKYNDPDSGPRDVLEWRDELPQIRKARVRNSSDHAQQREHAQDSPIVLDEFQAHGKDLPRIGGEEFFDRDRLILLTLGQSPGGRR